MGAFALSYFTMFAEFLRGIWRAIGHEGTAQRAIALSCVPRIAIAQSAVPRIAIAAILSA